MSQKRTFLLVETVSFAQPQRRHPIRMISVLSIRKVDEFGKTGAAGHISNFDHGTSQVRLTPDATYDGT
jgi:hypothetical protein